MCHYFSGDFNQDRFLPVIRMPNEVKISRGRAYSLGHRGFDIIAHEPIDTTVGPGLRQPRDPNFELVNSNYQDITIHPLTVCSFIESRKHLHPSG